MSAEFAHPKPGTGKNVLLWVVAVLLMFSAIVYQRRTGPTYPRRGEIQAAGEAHRYRLVRSEWSHLDARAVLPAADGSVQAVLHYKRYKLDEPWTAVPFRPAAELAGQLRDGEAAELDGKLVALLPKQPAAGKLEYYVDGSSDAGEIRIPPQGEDSIVIRFKDHVPGGILWPHVVMMFFAVLFGMRAGLSALFAPAQMRHHSWVALGGMMLGGMVLGPIVQKYAFGAYWTGFPYGGDLTDNKMLIMWLSWVFACSVAGLRARPRDGVSRAAVVLGALVMTAVYLIPHSMRGSELDYSKLEAGTSVHEAIGTSTD